MERSCRDVDSVSQSEETLIYCQCVYIYIANVYTYILRIYIHIYEMGIYYILYTHIIYIHIRKYICVSSLCVSSLCVSSLYRIYIPATSFHLIIYILYMIIIRKFPHCFIIYYFQYIIDSYYV